MKGVIQRVYDAWREKNGQPRQSVRQISDAELQAIYRENYWALVRGAELPPGLDLAVFDFGVNSGPTRSIRYLQTTLGITADGHMGPITIKAANDKDPAETVKALMKARRKFLNQIPFKGAFLKGWLRRCDGVEQACLVACNVPVKEAPLAPLADADEESATQGRATHDPKPASPTKVAAGALTAGATASQMISGPPEAVTTAVTQFSAWQSLVSTGQSLASWGWEHWPLVGGIAGTMLGLSYLNSRRTSE